MTNPNQTTNFSLRFLNQNQISKDIIVNENINVIDNLMFIKAIDYTNNPPANPSESDVYLVGSSPSGKWTGANLKIAIFSNGSWTFITPARNTCCYVIYHYTFYLHDGYGWKVASAGPKIGDYKYSAQKNDHDNWLLCNGREVSRSKYNQLFGLIGTSFGAGNGTTTFNLPSINNAQNCFLFVGLV